MKISLLLVLLGISSSIRTVVHGQEAASTLNTTDAYPSGTETKKEPDASFPSAEDSAHSKEQEPDELPSAGNEKSDDESLDERTEKLSDNTTATDAAKENFPSEKEKKVPVQSGPFIDLFGPTLLSLKMVDETRAQLQQHYTNEALQGKKVVGLYFSADWCGPCRQFTPDLVSFYNKMNARRGKENQFEIVWISRCRDNNSFGQYFTNMNWLALPPDLAMGQVGQMLSQKYKVKGIPCLVLLDEVGNVITADARNKIPQDKAGVGFPWRNPIATLYMTVLPKSLRHILRSRMLSVKDKLIGTIQRMLKLKATA